MQQIIDILDQYGSPSSVGTSGRLNAFVAATLSGLQPLPIPPMADSSYEQEAVLQRYGALRLLAGKDPSLANELVIIGIDLNSGDSSGWVGPAGVIELARQSAEWTYRGLFPRRSILFALWPDHYGLSDYLQMPLWPLDATHVVLDTGSDGETLATDYGVPIRSIVLPQREPEEGQDAHRRRILDHLHDAIIGPASGW